MKIAKLDNQNQIDHWIEVDTLTPELKQQGYYILDENREPEGCQFTDPRVSDIDTDGISWDNEYFTIPDDDTLHIRRIGSISDVYIEYQIKHHQAKLSSTDYIITKYAEATITPAPMTDDPDAPNPIDALGLDKYDLPTILQERAELREKIRSLRELLTTSNQ